MARPRRSQINQIADNLVETSHGGEVLEVFHHALIACNQKGTPSIDTFWQHVQRVAAGFFVKIGTDNRSIRVSAQEYLEKNPTPPRSLVRELKNRSVIRDGYSLN